MPAGGSASLASWLATSLALAPGADQTLAPMSRPAAAPVAASAATSSARAPVSQPTSAAPATSAAPTSVSQPTSAAPAAPPPRRIVEQGPSPYYYRKPRDTVGWGLRLGLGGSISLASTQPRPTSRFTLDVLPAVDLGFARGSRAGVLVEGGYSFTSGGTHLFVFGAGPAVRHFGPTLGMGSRGKMIAGLVAHGVVGTVAGATAAGVRTSALLHMWVIGLELGHQYVVAGAQRGHELRLMIDLGALGNLGR